MLRTALAFTAALSVQCAVAQSSFQCPDDYEGYYPHVSRCDQYWECQEGVSELKTCGNGLAFDDRDETYTTLNCAYLHNVECGSRTSIAEAIPAPPHCPRLFGIFRDPEDCTVFYECRNGKATRFTCSTGLAFDAEKRVCTYADQVSECKTQSVSEDGSSADFECPANLPRGSFGRYAHPHDCAYFYVCLTGGIARELRCPEGQVFAIGTTEYDGTCTDPEEVPECKDYYGTEDSKPAKIEINNSARNRNGPSGVIPTTTRTTATPTTTTTATPRIPAAPPRFQTFQAAPGSRQRPAGAVPNHIAALQALTGGRRQGNGNGFSPRFVPRIPVATTTTTTTPAPARKAADAVRAKDDYYYYYYYYDDEE